MIENISISTEESSFSSANSEHKALSPSHQRLSQSCPTSVLTLSELVLLEQINQGLSLEDWKTYAVLLAKRRAEQMNEKEQEVLITITNQIESINGHRLGLIIELAKLQNYSPSDLMKNYLVEGGSLIEKQFSEPLRKEVTERAGGFCEYCRIPSSYSFTPFAFEMIKPQIRGGKISVENITYSCQGCANYKYLETKSFDFISGCLSDLFNPLKDIWKENFHWTADFTQMIGLTAIGRATIAKTQLNRAGLINLRQILIRHGIYTPIADQ